MDHHTPIRLLLIEDDPIDRCIIPALPSAIGGMPIRICRVRQWHGRHSDTFEWRPDCILLDFNLPDLDGIAVLSRLNREGRHPCAVVMLTSYGGEALAVRAMKAGAMDYLVKGKAATDTLARTILHATERFRMQQQIAEQQAALGRSRQNYQNLLEAIPQMVWTAGPDGRISYANRRWFEYTGLDQRSPVVWGGNGCFTPKTSREPESPGNKRPRRLPYSRLSTGFAGPATAPTDGISSVLFPCEQKTVRSPTGLGRVRNRGSKACEAVAREQQKREVSLSWPLESLTISITSWSLYWAAPVVPWSVFRLIIPPRKCWKASPRLRKGPLN